MPLLRQVSGVRAAAMSLECTNKQRGYTVRLWTFLLRSETGKIFANTKEPVLLLAKLDIYKS